MADEIQVPDAPGLLPAGLQKKWRAAYAAAFKEAQNDFPEDAIQQRQTALREANRLLRVTPPTDYKSAMDLPDYLIHSSVDRDGKAVSSRQIDEKKGELKLVTIDGKKYRFPAPASAVKAAAAEPPTA
jgi:hypothetical protein